MNKNALTDQSKGAPYSIEASTVKDRNKIVSLLRIKPINTIRFREDHGLISPAPRIKELRKLGYDIKTTLIKAKSQDGRMHRNVALYTLLAEPLKQGEAA